MNIQSKLDNKRIERSNNHCWREFDGPEMNIILDNTYHGKTILTLVIK